MFKGIQRLIFAGVFLIASLFMPGLNQPVMAKDHITAACWNCDLLGQLDSIETRLLTDRVRSLVVQTSEYKVLERDNMDRILREQGFQATQECENDACSVKLGRLLAVRKIITGSISKLGSIYTLSLRIIDVEQGTIHAERFIDCNCSFETLLFERVSPLLQQLLGTESSLEPQIVQTSIPIRKQRPFQIGLEGGYSDYMAASFAYNINEYLAFRVGATYHKEQSKITYVLPPGLGGVAALRVYFNPHDLAGFLEVAATTEQWLFPRAGLEYRNSSGLNLWATGGAAFNATQTAIDMMLGIGYAF